MKRSGICLGEIVFALILCLTMWPGVLHAAGRAKVGIVLPLTGSLGDLGNEEKQSFEMAVEEINKNGGVDGKPLDLIFKDTKGSTRVGRSAAKKLITRDNVLMIGGGVSSTVTYAVAKLCQQRQIPFLVNTAAAEKISASGWNYVFRLNPPVTKYASGLELLFERVIRPKTAAILYEDSPVGRTATQFFERICRKLGIQAVLKAGYQAPNIDFEEVLNKVKQLNPDVIYIASQANGAAELAELMKQIKELNLAPKMFIECAGAFAPPAFQQDIGNAVENVISPALWHPRLPFPGAMDFEKKFEANHGGSADYHCAEAYSACYVIADTLKRSKSFQKADIRDALAGTDMMTIFGPVQFSTWGKMDNQNKVGSYVVQWINGTWEVVWPKETASHPLVYPVDWLKVWGGNGVGSISNSPP